MTSRNKGGDLCGLKLLQFFLGLFMKANTIFRVYVEVEYYDAGESGRKELPSGRKKR